MTFLEFHQLVSQDSLIYSWIRTNFSLTHQELEVGKELKLQHGQLIVMEKGLMVQESFEKSQQFNAFLQINGLFLQQTEVFR